MKKNLDSYPKTLAGLNKYVAEKFEGVELVKGKGYFYISPIDFDAPIAMKVCGLYTTSIMVPYLGVLTISEWLFAIDELLKDVYRPSYDESTYSED